MSGISDRATVTLNVNGAQAKQMMADLEKKVISTEQAIAKLKSTNADPKDIEKQRKLLKNYKKQLDEMRSATEGVNRAFKSLDTATPRELEKTLKTLNKQLKDMKPGTAAWNEHTKKIQQVNAQLKALKQQIQGQESLWQRFTKWWFNCGQAVAALVMGYQQLISTLRGYVNDYATMEEQMANTVKFTGLTTEGVKELNEAFKSMDTRTPREKLNELAQEAGRLGKNTKESIQGYVEAADIINVALADLGQGATQEIAKLTNIFDVEAAYGTRDAMLKVGSTVNVLSQNCTASKPYIVEFTKRLAGVGAQAKMTIPEIMAFAATLDANGQAVEMSASALSRTIMMLFQKPQEIAKTVGLDVEEFNKTLKRSTTEGLMMFFGALQKMGEKDALAALSPLFKDLGMDGVRMSTVLATVANKLDMVTWEMNEANKAFEEGTSATREYTIFNNTAQASIDKAKNRIHELSVELGEKLYPLMKYFMSSSTAALKILNVLVDFLSEYYREILVIASSLVVYKIAISAATLETKIHTATIYLNNKAIKLWRAATLLMAAAHGVLTGNLTKSRKAMRLFNLTMKTNPIGLVISLLASAALALVHFTKKTSEAANAQKILAAAEKEASSAARKEMSETQYLYEKTQDVTLSMQKRIAAAKELQKLHPDTFSNLSAEAIVAGDAANAYQRLADNILASARAKVYREKVESNTNDIVSKESRRDAIIQGMINEGRFDSTIMEILRDPSKDSAQIVAALYKHYEDQTAAHEGVFSYDPSGVQSDRRARGQALTKNLKKLQDDIDKLEDNNKTLREKIYGLQESQASSTDSGSGDGEDGGGGGGYTSTKLTEKEAKRKALEEKRALAKAKAAYRDSMESAKGDWEAGKAENLMGYVNEQKSYEDYLAEKERLDLEYIEKRMGIYENLYKDESAENKKLLLAYDEDYQELLLKKAEMEKKHADDASKRKVADWQREYKQEVDKWNLSFNNPGSDWYGDSFAQQEKLHELKIKYLEKYRDEYKNNSQEWTQYQQQIEDAEAAYILERRKQYVQKLESWRKKYSEQSLEQREKMELAVVQRLLDANLISLEEYKKKIAEISRAFASAKENAPTKPDENPSDKKKSWYELLGVSGDMTSAKEDLEKAKADLARQLSAGEIDHEEYLKKLKQLDDDYLKSVVQKFTQSLDPLGQSALKLAGTFADVFKSISQNGKISFENIADIAAASFAAMSAGLEMYGQFAEAQSKIDIANTEAKYDKEIEAMQGNSYKTAKLEKEKEAAVAKLKAEATKKEFNIKVAQAIANTAQSAILGYMAGLQAGFPMALWLAPSLAGLATATGMAQLALIKKQQKAAEAEGYAEGGFTGTGGKYEPAGIVHRNEWVASQELLANPVARPMIEALDQAQRTNTIGSLRAEDVSRSITANQSLVRMSESDNSSLIFAAVASQMSTAVADLTSRLNEPFVTVNTVTGDYGMQKAQDDYDKLMRNKSPKSKK